MDFSIQYADTMGYGLTNDYACHEETYSNLDSCHVHGARIQESSMLILSDAALKTTMLATQRQTDRCTQICGSVTLLILIHDI